MSKFYLENNRLKVEILKPGEIYKQSRFDWIGMIAQVTLDGKISYCVPESRVAGVGTNGVGMFNEFGIEEPIGYEEAAVGEKFPKLGIGLLTKYEEGAYKFYTDYEIESFCYSYVTSGNSITFNIEAKECRGYEVRQSKTIEIKENMMTVSYSIENIGKKPISTTEYIHNFVGINNCLIGPGYKLKFSEGLKVENLPEGFILNSNEVTFKEAVDREFYFRLKPQAEGKRQYWELVHEPSAAGVRETVDFEIERFAVWGKEHVISPEAFIKIDIKPGDKKEWSREYIFFNAE